MNNKFSHYMALAIISAPMLSFGMWRQFTRKVQSITPSIPEACEIASRDNWQFQSAISNLYNKVTKLNRYRNKGLDMQFLEYTSFINDLNKTVKAAEEARQAAYELKKTTENVKGETWQLGLVEEPATMSEIRLEDDNNYLILDQPKIPASHAYSIDNNDSKEDEWEVLGDFDNELE